eukprot:Nk52_evm68s62 gene=Nk52_evmTU68s62
MFTGIVQGLAEVVVVEKKENASRLCVLITQEAVGSKRGGLADGLEIGASVAINGCCLTVTEFEVVNNGQELKLWFDVMKETLRATNLGELEVGSRVDYERSARIGDENGGHNVSGHVDCTGVVDQRNESPNNCEVVIKFDKTWGKYVIPKGFVAVDGCSLTVVDVTEDSLSVWLIPETLSRSVMGFRNVGSRVNLEFDVGTKTLVTTLERLLPGLVKEQVEQIQRVGK